MERSPKSRSRVVVKRESKDMQKGDVFKNELPGGQTVYSRSQFEIYIFRAGG